MAGSWSDVSLETAACLLIAVLAYKLYRMRLSAESECCGGAVNVSAHNPGNSTPRALQGILGNAASEEGGRERVDEEVGLSLEEIEKLRKSRLVRTTNESKTLGTSL